jgi:hypothetical protein
MPENHAYSVNQPVPNQQSRQQSFAVVVIAIPADDAKAIALLPDFLRLPSDMAVILFEYGKPRKDAGPSRKAGGVGVLSQPAADARIQVAREGMSVEKDWIYVIPTGAGLEISDDKFVSSIAIGRGREKYLPDLLLAGLAYSWGSRVIAVLVSDGTSSGLSGSRVIREEGGFAFLLEDRNHRRMALTGIADPAAYADYLEKYEQEVSFLCQDLLTAEPGFLFDPGLGQMLEKEVLPRALSERKGLQPFRIWITGCTVSEMAFSVAIRISEYLEARSPGVPLQIFVTGLNRKALERARAGGGHRIHCHCQP